MKSTWNENTEQISVEKLRRKLKYNFKLEQISSLLLWSEDEEQHEFVSTDSQSALKIIL